MMLQLATESVWIYWAMLVMSGLCAGSLLNVVVYRLPLMMLRSDTHLFNLGFPRSYCPHCQMSLTVRDNIPLFSWLWLRGRCRGCREAISWRYPAIESLSLLIALLLASQLPAGALLLAALLLSWLLLALAIIDSMHFLLPDSLTLSLLWAGLLCHLAGVLPSASLEQGITGAASGYGLFWLLAWCYQIVRGEEGLGRGDAKLLAAGGAWLGWQALPSLLLLASSLGIAVFMLARLLVKRPLSARLPFGPALAVAIWIIFLWQNT
ncbi:prepilin peptidase [Pseudomonas graminis]